MSWKATGYVKELRDGLTCNEKFVLLLLAEYHRTDEKSAWPSVSTLAKDSLMTDRGVQQILARLEENGFIVKKSGCGRGNVSGYQIVGVDLEKDAPQTSNDGAVFIERTVHRCDVKGEQTMHSHVVNPAQPASAIRKEPLEPRAEGAATITWAEGLYALYPRKIAKREALKAIDKAVIRLKTERPNPGFLDALSNFEWLKKRVITFAASPAGKAGEYVPYPATWFNQSRYLDDEKEWNRSRDNGNGNHRAPSADPVEDMTVRNHREAITNYAKRGLHFILCNADLCEACANEKRKFPQIITPTQERERERLAAQ